LCKNNSFIDKLDISNHSRSAGFTLRRTCNRQSNFIYVMPKICTDFGIIRKVFRELTYIFKYLPMFFAIRFNSLLNEEENRTSNVMALFRISLGQHLPSRL